MRFTIIVIAVYTLGAEAQYVELNCTDCSGMDTIGVKLCCLFYTIELSEQRYQREVVILKPENASAAAFPNLRKIWIQGGLTIQPHAFSSAKNLEYLTLVTDSLQVLPAYAFTGATKLANILFFACYSIVKFDERTFVGLDNLDDLSFQFTPLLSPPKNLFRPLTNLRYITLWDTSMKVIHSELFANNLELEGISISSPLKAVERTFIDGLPNLRHIRVMGVDGSDCVYGDATFQAGDPIRSLNYFQFTIIVIAVYTLGTEAQYVELNCTDCSRMDTIGVKLCCLFYTIELSEQRYEREVIILKPENASADRVTDMKLNHPPVPFFMNETLVAFPNLRKIWIQGGLTIQPYAFSSAKNLEYLTLVTDSLQVLPAYAFTGATKLTSILFFACYSTVKFDEHTFVGLDNLDDLTFQSTPLLSPPKNLFRPLTNLRYITLYDTSIEVIHSELFANNLKLEWITIGSPLKAVERTFIDGLPNIRHVRVINFDGEECVYGRDATFHADDPTRSLSYFQLAMNVCYSNYEFMMSSCNSF
ncbi:Insulin-like growth factor-binding protein complex acid labile subunit [Pseudolycoriella hygida]|uniref:Insulin-like growth factor-binding protein complex acid labile subunit n=1 Tax=Pseudolycoriella hygida TaxID=35572 RepID=A0A9Q0S3L6_9DIPT|nr:Insulin-like growth factor-binding protein complex acid labile subunit [Pseudolycoriella hygida]